MCGGAAPCLGDQGDCFFQAGAVDVTNHDMCTFGRKAHREGSSETSGCAGHDDHLIFISAQLSHVRPLLRALIQFQMALTIGPTAKP
jgi:hypothetical protein